MHLKTPAEIELMREGGHILAGILDALVAAVKPGMQTRELETMAQKLISEQGAQPSFLNYGGFPAALCVSVNEEIVHGLPSERKLNNGDLVKLDLGVLYKGFHTDSARSVIIGKADPKIQNLVAVTAQALEVGIAAAQVGKTLGDVGHAIQEFLESHKMGVVRDLIGHGIGRDVHEAPEVPNYGKPGTGPKLVEGMTIAIEPMVTIGSYQIVNGKDGFAYSTADGKPAAHIEHTIAITKDGPVVLTK